MRCSQRDSLIFQGGIGKRMRAVLVGLGMWGQTLLRVVKSHEREWGMSLTTVCDRHEENLASALTVDSTLEVAADFADMSRRDRFDVALIATQPDTHYEIAREFLERGCHLFVEKPFVRRLDQAEELCALAEKKGLTLAVGHRLL